MIRDLTSQEQELLSGGFAPSDSPSLERDVAEQAFGNAVVTLPAQGGTEIVLKAGNKVAQANAYEQSGNPLEIFFILSGS